MNDKVQIFGTGYQHVEYARSYREQGKEVFLPRSGGWLLERQIKNTAYRDAMGCYPLFSCQSWQHLESDLIALDEQLVTVTMVTDPLGEYSKADLDACFPDLCVPFKEHYLVDLSQEPRDFISSHHRRYGKKASKACVIESCQPVDDVIDDWVTLYDGLIEHRNIRGFQRFSREIFSRQLAVPGMVVFRAKKGVETLGMTLWYTQGNAAYYHLGAYSDQGYQARASFGLFWNAINHFRATGIEWLDLGAGAGLSASDDDGLSKFKRGWSTGTKTAYLCGRVGNRAAYLEQVGDIDMQATRYFPAYREGEFQ